jgi:hypothetical protein
MKVDGLDMSAKAMPPVLMRTEPLMYTPEPSTPNGTLATMGEVVSPPEYPEGTIANLSAWIKNALDALPEPLSNAPRPKPAIAPPAVTFTVY